MKKEVKKRFRSENSFFPKNQRGSHVGIALSFVVFITFLIFLFSILEPAIKTQEDKESLLDYLETELIENFVENMTTFTIKINEPINPNKDCVKVQNVLGEITNEKDLVIKNESKDILNYSVQGNSLIIGTGKNFKGFLKFYYSDELGSSPAFEGGGCEPITNIIVGLIKTETRIFETIIEDLIKQYDDYYELLKEELKIPAGSEFGFSFTYSDGTIIGTEEKEISTSIYAEEILIQYIDEEANILSGLLNIKVW